MSPRQRIRTAEALLRIQLLLGKCARQKGMQVDTEWRNGDVSHAQILCRTLIYQERPPPPPARILISLTTHSYCDIISQVRILIAFIAPILFQSQLQTDSNSIQIPLPQTQYFLILIPTFQRLQYYRPVLQYSNRVPKNSNPILIEFIQLVLKPGPHA